MSFDPEGYISFKEMRMQRWIWAEIVLLAKQEDVSFEGALELIANRLRSGRRRSDLGAVTTLARKSQRQGE